MNVLLIEDEQKIADFVRAGLMAAGMRVEHCADGNAGYERARAGGWDAIVLDIMLPGRDGLSILSGLRAAGIATPVILLTARNELGDRIEGLERGADDYLAKPFFVAELVARLHAVVRRMADERHHLLIAGPLRLDRLARRLEVSGHAIELSTREFGLLEALMRAAGQTFTRRQLLEQVWGYDFDPGTNVVDVCIKRIRDKLAEVDPAAAAAIESVRGAGYRLRQTP